MWYLIVVTARLRFTTIKAVKLGSTRRETIRHRAAMARGRMVLTTTRTTCHIQKVGQMGDTGRTVTLCSTCLGVPAWVFIQGVVDHNRTQKVVSVQPTERPIFCATLIETTRFKQSRCNDNAAIFDDVGVCCCYMVDTQYAG